MSTTVRTFLHGWVRSFLWWPLQINGTLLTGQALAQTSIAQPSEWVAEQAEATVVLVRTRGPSAWVVAERRLAAELRSLEMEVVSEPIVRQVDELLPERALQYGAFVSVQVMRTGDRGLVRLWFSEQRDLSSGYQHVEVNLRNPEVVSRAVLPTVEAIYDRARWSRVEGDESDEDMAGELVDDVCFTGDADCRSRLSLRLGAGPWMVTASEVTAFAGVIGARSRVWSRWALDYEVSYQMLSEPDTARRLTGILLFRTHALLDLWTREGRGVSIGGGVGGVSGAAPSSGQEVHPLVSARAVLFARASDRLDVVFAVSGARAFGMPAEVPRGGWFADVMLALDWHVWK